MPRRFKALLAAALVLAAAAILLSAVLFDSINQSRVDISYDSCREQNARHDKTIAKLDRLIEGIKDPVRRQQAKTGRAGTLALIEALAPHQDCAALVKRRYGRDARPH